MAVQSSSNYSSASVLWKEHRKVTTLVIDSPSFIAATSNSSTEGISVVEDDKEQQSLQLNPLLTKDDELHKQLQQLNDALSQERREKSMLNDELNELKQYCQSLEQQLSCLRSEQENETKP